METDVRIRYLEEADLPALEWDGEYSRYRKNYLEIYRNKGKGLSFPFVAESAADGVIGQVFLTRRNANKAYSNEPYFFLTSFRVKPAYRDRGIGSRLLEACERVTREQRIGAILLNCAASNPRGFEFYRKHGFELVREELTQWSYVNENGMVVSEQAPSWLMRKRFPIRRLFGKMF